MRLLVFDLVVTDSIDVADVRRHDGQLVEAVEASPSLLGRLHQLEDHRQRRRPRTAAFGSLRSQSHGGEGRLDRVRGPQVDPVLGWVVVEREQHIEVVDDLGDGLGPLGAVVGGEGLRGGDGVVLVFGVVDLRKRGLRARVRGLRQSGENVADLVPLMPTSA